MAARLSWSNLVPGLIALTVLIAIGVVVLTYGSVGRVSGEKVRLHVVTDQARGVMPGTEVWLQGQRVGTVEKIAFRDPGSDTAQRVVISVEVRERAAREIRHDAEVSVRTGANLVGPVVVYISGGTPQSVAVREGDTLRATKRYDVENAMRGLDVLAAEFGPLMADGRQVVAHARDPRGTMGAAMRERGGPEAARLRASIGRLRASFGGTAADERAVLMDRARAVFAQVDSIRALLRSEGSSLGRFRRDSTLARTVANVRDELDSLRTRLATTDGTLDRLATDSAVTRALAGARQEMALLFEDMRKRPLRYIAF